MFNKSKRFSSEEYPEYKPLYPPAYAEDFHNWEEVTPANADSDEQSPAEYICYDEALPPSHYEPSVSPSSYDIGPDDNIIDISQFPALRMAFGQDEPEHEDEPVNTTIEQPDLPLPEYTAVSDGEDGLSLLIQR